MAKGTEALDSAKPKKKASSSGKSSTRSTKKAKKQVHAHIIKPLGDGSFHHETVYKGANGMPDPQTYEASTSGADDAGQHVAEMLGGGAGDDGDEDAAAAQPAPGAAQGQ